MVSGRRHRGWVARALVVALLFAQWATASYACPGLGVTGAHTAAAEAMAPMPDCDGNTTGMDPAQPQLCKMHCEAGDSVNSGAATPDVPVALAEGGAWAGVLDVACMEAVAAAVPPMGEAPPRSGAPPIYLSLHVLRN